MISISETACDKIKEMMATEDETELYLRLSVKSGGCSGFSYGMGLDDELTDQDQTLQINGLNVVIDADSSPYLNGLEIDYKESGMGGGFTIHNPNASATCGCGASFRTAHDPGVPSPAGEC